MLVVNCFQNDEIIAKELQADEAHLQETLDQMVQEDRIARQLLEEKKKSPPVQQYAWMMRKYIWVFQVLTMYYNVIAINISTCMQT